MKFENGWLSLLTPCCAKHDYVQYKCKIRFWVHLFNTSAKMSSPVQYKGFQRVWVVPVARVLPDSTHRPVRPAGDEQTYDNYDDDDKNLDDDNDDDGDDDKIVLSGSTRKPVFPAGDEQALRKS